MRSIWDEQSIQLDEIMLVKDGVLTNKLEQSIDHWKNKLKDILKIVNLEYSVVRLKKCAFNLVAR